MSVAEMKPSQVLREALALMEGGKKWGKFEYFDGERCCSLGAIRIVTGYGKTMNGDYSKYDEARDYLRRSVPIVSDWNDSAADFSVIQSGFEKAILLAESEGK